MPPQWQGSEDTLVPGEADDEGPGSRWVVDDSEDDET
jgi:hypothetical protein